MKKLVILVMGIFLLTGCVTNYNVIINEDLSVNEKVYIYGDNDLYKIYSRTTHVNVLRDLLEPYKSILEENNYKYQVNESNNSNIFLEKKYSTINNYIDSSLLFNDFFDEIKYTKEGNIIKIETVGFNKIENDIPDRFYVNELDISITSPYKVIKNNATSFDEKTNTLHFKITDKTEDFSISLEIDTSKKFNPHLKTYLMIGGTILIIILGWFVVFYLNKKGKN